MTKCKRCETEDLHWVNEFDKWKLYDKDDNVHRCSAWQSGDKIPLFGQILDHQGKNPILTYYREEYIASMQTEFAMKNGLDPYTVQFQREGDYLIYVKGTGVKKMKEMIPA